MTNLHFKFFGLSLGFSLCVQSSTNKSRQNRFITKITGESVLHDPISRCSANRLHMEGGNELFSLCIKDGTQEIGDSTKKRYVHNCTERF